MRRLYSVQFSVCLYIMIILKNPDHQAVKKTTSMIYKQNHYLMLLSESIPHLE